jgi:POT family proton-dependent oligopeptide transporter
VEAAFLPALLLLILGSGCLKGNIATQVGALYAPADRRRDRAYLLFNLGINLGAFAGPLVCGVLGEQGNWHWGFAMAGLGMLVGLAIYVTGWRHLPRDAAMTPPSAETPPPPIRAAGWRAAGAGGAHCLLQHPGRSGLQRLPLWIDAAANRQLGGFTIPVSWYLAADGLVTVLASPLVVMLWKRQTQRGTLPPVALRIGMGCAAMAAADAAGDPCSYVAAAAQPWPAGRLRLFPAGLLRLSLCHAGAAGGGGGRRAATPDGHDDGRGLCRAVFANLTGGWLARFYQPWGAERFWAFHAAIAATGVIVAVVARRPLAPDERA